MLLPVKLGGWLYYLGLLVAFSVSYAISKYLGTVVILLILVDMIHTIVKVNKSKK